MNWLNSVKLCEENGGHLLVIDSQKEANEILSLLDIIPYKGKDYWLGVHDEYNKGVYMTIFSKYN
ncbi:Hemolymph lipopolysaccharide-binding protein [Blattella germanica]|nr:Hemolymph lipopolysaccharide-binding protein [Blattella germanica]